MFSSRKVANVNGRNVETAARDYNGGHGSKYSDSDLTNPAFVTHTTRLVFTHGNQFKPNGIRNNFLTGHQIGFLHQQQQKQDQQPPPYLPPPTPTPAQRTPRIPLQPSVSSLTSLPRPPSGPPRPPSRDPSDDPHLVAMGSNWCPSGPQINGLRGRQTGTTANGLSSSSSSQFTPGVLGRKMAGMRVGQGGSTQTGSRRGQNADQYLYPDPGAPGAPPGYQHRLAEINSLEQETIRWEKQKRFKKKP